MTVERDGGGGERRGTGGTRRPGSGNLLENHLCEKIKFSGLPPPRTTTLPSFSLANPSQAPPENFSQVFANPRYIQVFFSLVQYSETQVRLAPFIADSVAIKVIRAWIAAAQANKLVDQYERAYAMLLTKLPKTSRRCVG